MQLPITLSPFERAQACVMAVMYIVMLHYMVEFLLFIYENNGLPQASQSDVILCICLLVVLCISSITWMRTLGIPDEDVSDITSPDSL